MEIESRCPERRSYDLVRNWLQKTDIGTIWLRCAGAKRQKNTSSERWAKKKACVNDDKTQTLQTLRDEGAFPARPSNLLSNNS